MVYDVLNSVSLTQIKNSYSISIILFKFPLCYYSHLFIYLFYVFLSTSIFFNVSSYFLFSSFSRLDICTNNRKLITLTKKQLFLLNYIKLQDFVSQMNAQRLYQFFRRVILMNLKYQNQIVVKIIANWIHEFQIFKSIFPK